MSREDKENKTMDSLMNQFCEALPNESNIDFLQGVYEHTNALLKETEKRYEAAKLIVKGYESMIEIQDLIQKRLQELAN